VTQLEQTVAQKDAQIAAMQAQLTGVWEDVLGVLPIAGGSGAAGGGKEVGNVF